MVWLPLAKAITLSDFRSIMEFIHESGNSEQDMHGALGWIMKQLLTRMVKRTDNMRAFQESLLKDAGYTLEELQNSYKRVAEFVENNRKILSP